MPKSKRKGGLSGVSRFVFESMQSKPADSDAIKAPPPESTGLIDEIHEETTKPPTKKRKRNDGTSVDRVGVQEQRWIEKYDATGLVPHYAHTEHVPDHLQKFKDFSQRYRFFSLYSSSPGCLLDEEGWYSITPELIADQIAERCRCNTILDAFCGVGGNSIAFAKTCQRVIALDTSPTRLALARHNAQIYGVADRIEFILSDYISFTKAYLSQQQNASSHQSRKIDVVFLSPPWGGPSYLSGTDISASTEPPKSSDPTSTTGHPLYSLSSIRPIPGTELFDLTRKITKNVAYYLPRNTALDEISSLVSVENAIPELSTIEKVSPSERIEVEEEWMGNKLKALTCYFGGLAHDQQFMF